MFKTINGKTTVRIGKMEKKSVSPTQRCLRNRNVNTVLTSRENRMGNSDTLHIPGVKSKQVCSRGSLHRSTDSCSPLVPNVKLARVLSETKTLGKTINVGKRATRSALKIYDYGENDSETENIPEQMSKEKPRMSKVEKINSSKRKRSSHTNTILNAKSKTGISSPNLTCSKKFAHDSKYQSKTPVTRTVKTERRMKKSVLGYMSAATPKITSKVNVDLSKCTEPVLENERKSPLSSLKSRNDGANDVSPALDTPCAVGNKIINAVLKAFCSISVVPLGISPINSQPQVQHAVPTLGDKNLNGVPKESCSTPVVLGTPVVPLGISPINSQPPVQRAVSSSQHEVGDTICEYSSDSEVFVNAHKQQGLHSSVLSTEGEEEFNGVCYAEVHPEPPHLGLTSTPEKNSKSGMCSEYSSFVDSGINDIIEVTLYDSPQKLSPIKTVASPASSVSNDSCYWNDDFESLPDKAIDTKITPSKSDIEERVVKSLSFKAYHTPHQFRRHLFQTESKKIPKKKKSRSPAEVKLDLWASVMNNHFQDIEDSELVVE